MSRGSLLRNGRRGARIRRRAGWSIIADKIKWGLGLPWAAQKSSIILFSRCSGGVAIFSRQDYAFLPYPDSQSTWVFDTKEMPSECGPFAGPDVAAPLAHGLPGQVQGGQDAWLKGLPPVVCRAVFQQLTDFPLQRRTQSVIHSGYTESVSTIPTGSDRGWWLTHPQRCSAVYLAKAAGWTRLQYRTQSVIYSGCTELVSTISTCSGGLLINSSVETFIKNLFQQVVEGIQLQWLIVGCRGLCYSPFR